MNGLFYFDVHCLRVRRISTDVEVPALPREPKQNVLAVFWAWTRERKWRMEQDLWKYVEEVEKIVLKISPLPSQIMNLIRVNLAEDPIYRDVKINALRPKYRYGLHLRHWLKLLQRLQCIICVSFWGRVDSFSLWVLPS